MRSWCIAPVALLSAAGCASARPPSVFAKENHPEASPQAPSGDHRATGTFVLQHSGTMNRGEPQLRVTIVPESGTGELTGISGSLTIDIVDKKHLYALNYGLARSP